MLPDPAVLATLLRCYDREGGRHAHDHAQVLFGVEGTLQLEVEGRTAWVDATCGLVVPAGATHGYAAVRTARVLVLDLPAGPATDRMRRFMLPRGWRDRWSRREVPARPPPCEAVSAGDLLSTLLAAPTLAARRRLDFDALAARIDADLARRWTVADLAAACCLSPQRLRARFAEALGLAPLDFVRLRRLDRAEVLLHQGLPLDAVALQVGYARASALSAALRRERDTGARALRQRRAVRET